MKKIVIYIIIFIAGVAIAYLLFNLLTPNRTKEQFGIIDHEIKKLNKMIVVEQDFSAFQTHENSNMGNVLDGIIEIDSKKLILYVEAKAQVIYDMKKMDIEIDSSNKVIRIKKIPEPEVQIIPNVKIYDLQQSLLNKYSKEEINEIQEKAKEDIRKKAETTELLQKGRKQLIENLSDIYKVADILGWKVVDDTGYSKEIKH